MACAARVTAVWLKVKLQNYFIGAACNLKRWLRRLAWELQNASLKSEPERRASHGELSPKRRAWSPGSCQAYC